MDKIKPFSQKSVTFPSNAVFRSDEQLALEKRLEDFIRLEKRSMAPKTLEAMKYDWSWFFNWCYEGRTENSVNNQPRCALPASPQTLIDFIFYWVGLRAPSSIRRCLSHIAQTHQGAGLKNPLTDALVKSAMKKIGRQLHDDELLQKKELIAQLNIEREQLLEGLALSGDVDRKNVHKEWTLHHNRGGDQRQAKGLQWHHMSRIHQLLTIEPLLEGVSGRKGTWARKFNARQIINARNRAIIAVAYDTLCRASELVSFSIEDIDYKAAGHAHLILRTGKTNQQGKPKRKYLSESTVLAIETWLGLVDLVKGPLFCPLTKGGKVKMEFNDLQKTLSTRSLLYIYKSLAEKIGEKPALFSCHSSRVGATQDMLGANISMLAVKQAGDWKSDRMPSRYAEETEVDKGGMAQLSMKQNRR